MKELLSVGIGGFIGAILRYTLLSMIQDNNSIFPIGTLVVNFVGTLLLGIVVYSAELIEFISPEVRIFLTIGVLGSFTTMSTFGLEAFMMFENSKFLLLAIYIVGTVVLVFVGMFTAKISVNFFSRSFQITGS